MIGSGRSRMQCQGSHGRERASFLPFRARWAPSPRLRVDVVSVRAGRLAIDLALRLIHMKTRVSTLAVALVVLSACTSAGPVASHASILATATSVRVQVPPGGPGSVMLPSTWFHASSPIARDMALALVASTNERAVDGASYDIAARWLRPSDAYLTIRFSVGSLAEQGLPPIPAELSLEAFTDKGTFLGAPLHLFSAGAPGGGEWELVSWAGPKAGVHAEQLTAIVSSLRLAGVSPSISPPPPPETIFGLGGLQGLHMLDAKEGWAWGCDHLWHTSDGGSSWSAVTPKPVPCQYGLATAFLGTEAWVAEATKAGHSKTSITVYRTKDGGRTWRASTPIVGPNGGGGWIEFVDPEHGFMLSHTGGAMGSDGVAVFRTTDGGIRWSRVSYAPLCCSSPSPDALPSGCDKTGMSFADHTTGWVTAYCAGNQAFLYVTHDGGTTWAMQPLPPIARHLEFPAAPRFTSPLLAFAAALTSGTAKPLIRLVSTSDGGMTWSVTRLRLPVAHGTADFLNSELGWVAGRIAGEGMSVLRSVDGGATWIRLPAEGLPFTTMQLDFVSAAIGFAVSEHGLFATTDSGRIWHEVRGRIARS